MENQNFFHECKAQDCWPESDVRACHSKDWKIFYFSGKNVIFHIPDSSLFLVPDQTLLDHGTGCIGKDCLFCELEEELPKSVKPKPVVNISSIALNVIERCNMRCTYCFAGNGDYGYDSKMNPELARKVIRFFTKDKDKLHIIFFGGEPLLNFALIKETVLWCQSLKGLTFTYGLTTNGLLLTRKKLDFFLEHQFHVKLSWDGPLLQKDQRRIPSLSNHRGKDPVSEKFNQLSQALMSLRSFKIRTTLDKKYLPKSRDNILNLLNSHQYKLAFSRVSSSNPELMYSEKDVRNYAELLKQLTDHFLNLKDYVTLQRISTFKTLIRIFHKGKFHRNFCGAGLNYLSVSTRGKFYLCHRFTEDEEECLGDLNRGLNLDKIQEVVDQRGMTQDPCRSCWMREVCAGGCFHEHKMGRGSIRSIDPLFCQIQEAEMTQALRAYLEIQIHAPELLN